MSSIKRAIVFLSVVATVGVGAANDLFVDKTGADGAYMTIQAAVSVAREGDTVWVRPGVYDQGGGTFSYTYGNDASGALKGQTR